MVTAIGNFGHDHQWWGQPQYQDSMPLERGGPIREIRNETGANVMADFATGMALVGKMYRPFDEAYAEKCVEIAADLYAFAKQNPDSTTETPAYNGNGTANDELALAAVSLLWATEDRQYLQDLAYDKTIGTHGNSHFAKLSYEGGWFSNKGVQFSHDMANTDWASVHVLALYGFFKLILTDEALCSRLGIEDQNRLKLLEKTAYQSIYNLGAVSLVGDETIELPNHDTWGNHILKYEKLWKTMHTQQEWVWNRYQMGNLIELYCYSDIASYIQGMELPNTPATTDWKGTEVRQVMVEAMDYMLGRNPWDVSMIYGVGNKNFNHPHHRAANPEGKNVPGAFYRYVPPTGALQGGYMPGETNIYNEHYDDYHHSEIGIDANAVTIFAVTALAKNQPVRAPGAEVRIVYVGHDRAIIDIRQDKYGDALIRYGVASGDPDQQQSSDSSGVYHRMTLENLQSGTDYHFDVVVSDLFDSDSTILNKEEYFTFTTANAPPGDAEITNVKVCKVTSDSAGIFWFTPNGEFDSKVVFGTEKPPAKTHEGDVAGHPVRFHYVKIGGLKEKTTYYFHVESNGSIDNNDGDYYTFTTPVEHVDFDIRTVSYDSGGIPSLGMIFVNQDHKSYDSLELRLYMRGTDEEMADLGARVDIGIKYRSDGYQDKHFKGMVDGPLQEQKPIKMAETYDPNDGTYAWYFPVPLGEAQMESQARFRLDILFVKRNIPFDDNLLHMPATHKPGGNDWSWRAHSRPQDPFDFGGIEERTKEDIDNDYWNMEINRYVTVYRKGEFVWGYSPSHIEQSTKKTNYEMTAQVTDPLHNPSADYVALDRQVPQIMVSGWAQITEDGTLNEIWVNGHKQENVSDLIAYDAEMDKFFFDVPVPVDHGANIIDITLFGGPPGTCEDCYGCAFSNHHFYVEFTGAKQYDGELVIKDASNQAVINPEVKVDTTSFFVEVDDKNGDIDSTAIDSLHVAITSPLTGDSLSAVLYETGPHTGVFTGVPVMVTSELPANRPADAISVFGGDTIWIKYQDPFNPSDYSRTFLYSKASFPVARTGKLLDTDGDGTIDDLEIFFTGELLGPPRQISILFPDSESELIPEGNPTVNGNTVSITLGSFPEYTTGFAQGIQSTSGSATITHNGRDYSSTFALFDSAGPVLSEAILVENEAGNSDILVIDFSEKVDTSSLIGQRLKVKHVDGENTDLILLSYSPDPSGGVRVVVTGGRKLAPGDSIYLTPGAGGIQDMCKNFPHRNNKPVELGYLAGAARIVGGWYEDRDADGILDFGCIQFDRKVKPNDISELSLLLADVNYSVDSEYVDIVSDSAISISIKDAVNTTTIATGGSMSASVKFNRFPGVVREVSMNDSAAPVISSAEYIPGRLDETGGRTDTLIVQFSESVNPITTEKPFVLSSAVNSVYSMVLDDAQCNARQCRFVVKSFDPETVRYPAEGDRIRIAVSEVSDAYGTFQENQNNRECRLMIKSVPYQWTLRVGPNPHIIGSSEPVCFDFESLTPIMGKTSLQAHVKIFDALGNLIIDEKATPENTSLRYYWPGTNRADRNVGAGTYMAIVNLLQNNQVVFEKTVMIGVKKP